MLNPESFARRVFFGAAVYGVLMLLPQYFLREAMDKLFPPPINHLEHFYGFVGVALAWQLAFLAIAREPLRLRPVMIAAAAEKLLFSGSSLVLIGLGRVPAILATVALVDLALGVLFTVSYGRLAGRPETAP